MPFLYGLIITIMVVFGKLFYKEICLFVKIETREDSLLNLLKETELSFENEKTTAEKRITRLRIIEIFQARLVFIFIIKSLVVCFDGIIISRSERKWKFFL